MFTRLVRLVGGIAMMLAMTCPSDALGESPTTVHPSAKITSSKVSGDSVHFVVEVTFAIPPHSAASSACTGKVEVSKAKGHRKGPHWTGALAPHGDVCRAKIKGRLPAELLNSKVPFTISFDGNGVVAPFSKGATLKLSPPGGSGQVKGPPAPAPAAAPAPGSSGGGGPNGSVTYTAADGNWHAAAGGLFTDFLVEGGAIKHNFSSNANMALKCTTYDGSPKENLWVTGFDYRQDLSLDPSGNFSGHYTREFEQEFPETTIHLILPQTIHGHLGATTGEVVVDVAGASLSATGSEGHSQSGCSTSVTLEAFKQP